MFNQRQIEKAMKKMGMKTEEMNVKEVLFRGDEKEYIIRNPSVSKIEMGGTTTFQVIGNLEEKQRFSEDDIKIIIDQTGCSPEEAKKTLNETNDIAEAILKLKKE
ncbi:MAG: nascent polypeptide-associated complex protein [Candidatus Aenigmarchaeota archaeon]|nr:nascent polypeptide-associated complex protein [Candidatus Aenigmarchaeota archaeon]